MEYIPRRSFDSADRVHERHHKAPPVIMPTLKRHRPPRGDFPHYAVTSWRVALALIMAFVALALHGSPTFTLLENILYDWRVRDSSASDGSSERIVIIGVDDKSLGRMAPEAGPWPWPRELLGKILRYCEQAEAVGVEILLFQQQPLENETSPDEVLIGDVRAADNVFLAVQFTHGVSDTDVTQQLASMAIRAPTNIPARFPTHSGVMAPFSELLESCRGFGHVNLIRDPDGVVRSYRAVAEFQGRLYPSLAVILAAQEMGLDPSDIEWTPDCVLHLGDVELQLEDTGDFLFLPNRLPFTYFSAADVIRSCDIASQGGEPRIPQSAFKDRIVLVGMTASRMGDHEHLSTTRDAAGITIVASAVENILEQKTFHRASRSVVVAIMLAIALVPALPGLRRARFLTFAGFAMLALYVAVAMVAVHRFMLMLPITGPILSLSLSCAGLGALYVAEDRARRKYVRTTESAKQQLTDLLVHDLKNTVMPITMALAMRSDGTESDDADSREFWRNEFADIVEVSTNKLMTQINALMDIRRMQRGHLQLKASAQDPERLLQAVETKYRKPIERAELKLACKSSLPLQSRIPVDAEVFGRMMGSILWNAVAHAARGSTIEVEFRLSGPDGVACHVSCPGRTIPPEDQEHLFVAFAPERSREPPSDSISSAALGLTFCKLAMEAHGGSITLFSPRPGGEDGVEVCLCFTGGAGSAGTEG